MAKKVFSIDTQPGVRFLTKTFIPKDAGFGSSAVALAKLAAIVPLQMMLTVTLVVFTSTRQTVSIKSLTATTMVLK